MHKVPFLDFSPNKWSVHRPAAAPPAGDLPPEYARLTANAERLSVDFRFRTGSSQLDNKAVDDLDRVTTYLASPTARGKEVMLIGFADNTGNPQFNNSLSNERAKIVARQFSSRTLFGKNRG